MKVLKSCRQHLKMANMEELKIMEPESFKRREREWGEGRWRATLSTLNIYCTKKRNIKEEPIYDNSCR